MKTKIAVFILIMISNILGAIVISDNEKKIMNSMLEKVQLDTTALNFPKNWASSKFKIKKMIQILEQPLEFPKFVDEVKDTLLVKNSNHKIDFMFNTILEKDSLKIDNHIIFSEIDKKFKNIKNEKDILKYAKFCMEKSEKILQPMLDSLSLSELKSLESFIYSIRKDEKLDKEKYENFSQKNNFTQDSLKIENYISMIKKTDLRALQNASKIFFYGINKLESSNFRKIKFKKKYLLKSKFGLLVCGTKSDDNYKKRYAFIYDPAGNDIYTGNISTNLKNHFCAIIDKKGDDIYRNPNLGELFNITFGIGYLCDESGNDYYYGDDFAFSANFGSLLVKDNGGNDTFLCGKYSLGAASFGVALIQNTSGNDFYSGSEFSQGFGGPLGCGILADYSNNIKSNNNDVYFAGGKYLHEPLAPNDYRALSQGFGFGIRPDIAGGIGIIFDQKGNDHYNGGVFSQGVGYWFALGMLIDLEGNDDYHSVYYPQGSGIHLAAGFLYDEDGDDNYYSKHGPGQGAGHDYGVGFLVDRSGNDAYSVEGGNGLGITNSVGVFLDVAGNDRYERKYTESYGYGKKARESGSLGLFLDTNGNDIYPNKISSNNSFWDTGYFGFGLDTLTFSQKKLKSEIKDEPIDIDSLSSIEKIFEYASEWEVGSTKKRVRFARKLLISQDKIATDYICKNKLDTKSGLEMRAIVELSKNSNYMKKKLSKNLKNKDERIVRNIIYLIGEIADTSYVDTLKIMMKNKKYTSSVLSCLGKMKTNKSLNILAKYIDSENVYWRVTTARSLKKIATPKSLKLLETMKNDKCFLIKSMFKSSSKTYITKE